ncbi:hypothetical protein SSAmo_0140 [Enterobacterales bacterium endosymbiont of Anomoneura mori]|uniref:translation initiation factor IF-2 n=1 Tax=Enterobacterales bacterium endosymbiont of Anomoneura mori TaxID=3132096 RepID=UPI00399D2FA3
MEKNIIINKKNNKKLKIIEKKNISKYIEKYKKHNFNIIILYKYITLLKLSNIINFKYFKLLKKIIKLKKIILNEEIIKSNIIYLILKKNSNKIFLYKKKKEKKKIKKKNPIVTIMGHVNHGKTSLLDYIRSTNIVSKESGNITQHIGIYNIKTKNGFITFLDTPGHEIFNSMRKKGIKNTDIIVLVIAVDDGIMPQTIETIEYSKKFKIPLIIALNKIDKKNLNLNIIKEELTKYKIISEEWGGETQFVNISAKTGKGVNKLINSILLESEILEIKKNKDNNPNGIVIESYYDKGSRPIIILLLKKGIIYKNDIIIYNFKFEKIKLIRNIFGKNINIALPSMTIEIIGLSFVPKIGDKLYFLNNKNNLNKFLNKNIINNEENKIEKVNEENKIEIVNEENKIKKVNEINKNININKKKIFKINIIIKSDVLGTCEVIKNELLKLSNDIIKINIINLSINNINENDLILALNNKAIILCFNINKENLLCKLNKFKNLDIRYYSIIYKLIKDVKKIIINLSSEHNIKQIGSANICSIFKIENLGNVAGCIITNGTIKKNNKIKILRNNKIIFKGIINSLKHFKKNIKEVKIGTECGIYIKNFDKFKIKDKIEVYN